ncbi:MAG: Uma2 family endonuclease [Hyphomicrobiaceae bacterium]|nr:Uma2 family endonuclease [Hyphomicrobiaceae bacterium]
MNQHATFPTKLMTVEEFLDWDGGGHVGKLELVEGQVRAMAPASDAHSTIQLNIGAAIHAHLRASKSGCRVGKEAPVVPPLRAKINARAPDLAVTCSPPSASKVYEAPILIIEVMSPSNEKETWESIHAMANATSLREIVVVQSTEVEARVFTRAADGSWPDHGAVTGPGGTIRMASIGFELSIADVYENTLLAEAAGSAG